MDDLKKIIRILPYEIILLNLLKQTNNDDIRDFILKTNNYSMLIGYIPKIFNLFNYNYLHILKINDELYINHNLYDFIIHNNKIIPKIYDYIIEYINISSFEDIHNNIFKSNLDFIIIQEDYAEPLETKVFKDYILNNEKIFNIKNYISNNKLYNFFNFNYLLDTIFFKDCIYFTDNNKKFIYKDGIIKEFEWNIDNINNSILLSIYRLIT